MSRDRSTLGQPLGVDGPWLAAILEALDDIADLLRQRLPAGDDAVTYGPNEILLGAQEPAPQPNNEPAGVEGEAPGGDTADVDEADATPAPQPVKVSEPAPDNPPLPEPPPRAGRGASAEAWQTWAARAGVATADGATRADIIAACERAGAIPTEQE